MRQQKRTSPLGISYLIYSPANPENEQLPVLFYFHGAGERGSNLENLLLHGPPKLIEEGMDFPFAIISPQCPSHTYWRQVNLIPFIDEIMEDYCFDRERVYISGNSMGGYCCWFLANSFPYLFAAMVPICGGGDSTQVHKIKHLPVWVFHGENDEVVPYMESVKMVKRLREVGGNVQFTTYKNTGHDSWTEAYNHAPLYDWLLKQKRT